MRCKLKNHRCRRRAIRWGSSSGSGYYVSESGTGDGLSESTPMSPGDFELLVLVDNDNVFFNAGDEF